MKRHCFLPIALFISQVALAQPVSPAPSAPTLTGSWSGGLGVGNGVEIHAGYFANRFVVLGRTRYKWWRPDSGPGSSGLFRRFNTRSRQTEVAALAGYSVPVRSALVYAGAGVGYVAGRQLGDYRYTLRGNAAISNDTYYYAYRRYQAIGLPLEVGFVCPAPNPDLNVGISFQANLNPEQSVFCLLVTLWGGQFSRRPAPAR
ncbi:hypothetical protein BEN47_09045 [Hymenobacter lapidarius]|uniref:Outer membrane protein beta-barrel domain-containing protein n=1 Tax=Hymenobacter lapidarius TaxID=1908237 RepID=A0A1G1TBJ4_9BACT|nr:hypothetical protein [Hymenobacter lapidarius]OGX88226.1 hypothetical protein BEN47_09045 [Hymenobacter lapidarius]